MTIITKDLCKNFRGDFDKVVSELADKYNVKIELGNIRFDMHSFQTQLKVSAIDEDTADLPGLGQWHADFKKHAEYFGMDPCWLGRVIKLPQGEFRICGLKPKCNNPVLIQQVGSKFTEKFQRISAAAITRQLDEKVAAGLASVKS